MLGSSSSSSSGERARDEEEDRLSVDSFGNPKPHIPDRLARPPRFVGLGPPRPRSHYHYRREYRPTLWCSEHRMQHDRDDFSARQQRTPATLRLCIRAERARDEDDDDFIAPEGDVDGDSDSDCPLQLRITAGPMKGRRGVLVEESRAYNAYLVRLADGFMFYAREGEFKWV
jgi:hypothetical protein